MPTTYEQCSNDTYSYLLGIRESYIEMSAKDVDMKGALHARAVYTSTSIKLISSSKYMKYVAINKNATSPFVLRSICNSMKNNSISDAGEYTGTPRGSSEKSTEELFSLHVTGDRPTIQRARDKGSMWSVSTVFLRGLLVLLISI